MTDEANGLFCNDQKIEPSFLELIMDIMPEVEGLTISSLLQENLTKFKGLLAL